MPFNEKGEFIRETKHQKTASKSFAKRPGATLLPRRPNGLMHLMATGGLLVALIVLIWLVFVLREWMAVGVMWWLLCTLRAWFK
jgi:hypothetical protein